MCERGCFAISSKVVFLFGRGGNHHLSGVEQDEVGTALIPRDTFTGYIALGTTGMAIVCLMQPQYGW